MLISSSIILYTLHSVRLNLLLYSIFFPAFYLVSLNSNPLTTRWQCYLLLTSLVPRLLQLTLLRCWTYRGPESPEQGLKLLIEEKLIISMRVVARGTVEKGMEPSPHSFVHPSLVLVPQKLNHSYCVSLSIVQCQLCFSIINKRVNSIHLHRVLVFLASYVFYWLTD
jgi:hypothetical protein